MDHSNAGPKQARGCTDLFCLIVFVLWVAVYVFVGVEFQAHSDVHLLLHGTDYKGKVCGVDQPVKDLPYVYFYQLEKDVIKDPSLRIKTGICVNSTSGGCPRKGETVADPYNREKKYTVALPTAAIVGRCIPYQEVNRVVGTPLCADPKCGEGQGFDAMGICGTRQDGTDQYWILGKPDWYLMAGWEADGYIEKKASQWEKKESEVLSILQEYGEKCEGDQNCRSKCNVIVDRVAETKIRHSADSVSLNMLTQYTGIAFHYAQVIYEDLYMILALGLGGSLLCSFVVILLFATCAKLIVYTLTLLLFMVLIAMDYILYVQAGKLTGAHGREMTSRLSDFAGDVFDLPGANSTAEAALLGVMNANADESVQRTCYIIAIVLSGVIVAAAFLVCCVQKHFAVCIALLREAGRICCDMPSLLIYPFFGVAKLVALFGFAAWTALCIMTVETEWFYDFIERLNLHKSAMFAHAANLTKAANLTNIDIFTDSPVIAGECTKAGECMSSEDYEKLQRYLVYFNIFMALWVYFFILAVFKTVIATAVSNWYFYKADPENSLGAGRGSGRHFFGLPVLVATSIVYRYHLGSMAFGSFLLATLTAIRIAFEYMQKQLAGQEDSNPTARAFICLGRCVLSCLDCFLQFISGYAYVNIGITGKSFCGAARSAFKVIVENPIQVALDEVVSAMLRVLACVVVPLSMVIIVSMIDETYWYVSGFVVGILSYAVTRVCVAVYDICITTLFMCAMRDQHHYGGKYMLMHSDELASALKIEKANVQDVRVEMAHRSSNTSVEIS